MQETENLEISNKTKNKEFFFTIKNYREENNGKKLTDINLEFAIEIEVTNREFPVEYKIYDFSNNEEIIETKKIKLTKEKEFENKYKLVIYGKENETNKVLVQSDINIKVKVYGKYNYTETIKAFSLKKKKTEIKQNITQNQEEYIAPASSSTNESIYNENIPVVEVEKEKNKPKVDINYTIERIN